MSEIIPFGDCAILVRFEQKIDPLVNNQVISLYQKVIAQKIDGVLACSPAYCSLTIQYSPSIVSFLKLKIELKQLINPSKNKEIFGRRLRIPVCYEGEYGPDLDEVAQMKNLKPWQIVDYHTREEYRVYMIGFLPGFAYMGKVDEKISVPRKKTPRLKVEAGSVGLAGLQTGIYPSEAPGGWQIIGRTPLKLFQPERKPYFFFQPGDRIRFDAITTKDLKSIQHKINNHTFDFNQLLD